MGIVGRGAAELIVGDGWPEPGWGRSGREVLQLAAPPEVADRHVELAVGPELDYAGVVVASRRLGAVGPVRRIALTGRHGSRVVLEGEEGDQMPVEAELGAVPHEPVDAVGEQRDLEDIARVG